MRFHRGRAGTGESAVSYFLLAVLVLIGAGVYRKQFHYNPADFGESAISALTAPAGYIAAPKTEMFDADTLYSKIDGKADLYLESGFKRLDCRIFKSRNDPNIWAEIFVYDMDTPKNALAVFGVQRRAEGQGIEMADFAYKTPDAVFLAKGKYYVEITGSTVSEPLASAMQQLGKDFVNKVGSKAGQIEELSRFPKENLVPQSFKLYISSAYGYEAFRDLYAAKYDVNGSQTTAFICKLPDGAAAEKLAADYRKFLLDNGGTVKRAANESLKGTEFEIANEIEIVFAKGVFVAGVHAAEKQNTAEIIALRILESLSK
jgi:hypothetical protein